MGFFGKLFEKKVCDICGDEIGLLGNRKLEDGNCCKNCAGKLSPWFEERRHSTVEQIKQQLAYREQNARDLENFAVFKVMGDGDKMYLEEVNGKLTRFFVTDAADYKAANPDIISFRDVSSCTIEIDTRDEEVKQRNSEGQMVSYNPPRFKHHYNFIIRMGIMNNPYFDDIHFTINKEVVTLESVGGAGPRFATMPRRNIRNYKGFFAHPRTKDERRYNEYLMESEHIEALVSMGRKAAQRAEENLDEHVQHAAPVLRSEAEQQAPSAAQPAARPKLCPNCGAPDDGSKFCQNCGSRL
jgi:hypothetical protein